MEKKIVQKRKMVMVLDNYFLNHNKKHTQKKLNKKKIQEKKFWKIEKNEKKKSGNFKNEFKKNQKFIEIRFFSN